MESIDFLSLEEDHLFFGQGLDDSFEFPNENNFNLFPKENDFLMFSNLQENIFSKSENNIKVLKASENSENNKTNSNYIAKGPENSQNENQTTFNTSKNSKPGYSILDNSKSDISKNIAFKTVLHHKRGRKEKSQKKIGVKYHGSGDLDNIQRKIQVSFFNFLINLANDAIKTVFGKKTQFCFKDVNYQLKKVVNYNYAEKLKLFKYSDIIQMEVSSKIKNYKENFNRETYMKICELSPKLKKMFDSNYLYMFKNYFCEIKENQNIIDFDGLKIILSTKTKGLFYLLRKNGDTQEQFKNVIKNVYFSGYNFINERKNIRANPLFISH